MFTFEQVKELIDLTVRHRLQEVEVEADGFRVRVRGGEAIVLQAAPAPVAAPVPPQAAPAAPAGVRPEAPVAATPAADLHVVTSPIVGTFYGSPSPDAPPFVQVGDRVKRGQVLCIVEAMKLMNEIESDADGVVVEIHPQNAQPVEYGEP